MPVISIIEFNSLTVKISEYSRLEQVAAVLVGLVGVYLLHAVCYLCNFREALTVT